jgi:hypothetical protein
MGGTVGEKDLRGFPPLTNGNTISNRFGGSTATVTASSSNPIVLSSTSRKLVSEEENVFEKGKYERIPSLPLAKHRHHSLDSSSHHSMITSDRPSHHPNLSKPCLSVSARENNLREGKREREGEGRLVSPRTMVARENRKEERDVRLSSNDSMNSVNDISEVNTGNRFFV